MMAKRYTCHGQSVQCPDGYAHTIYYVWDDEAKAIIAADHEHDVAKGYAAMANRGLKITAVQA